MGELDASYASAPGPPAQATSDSLQFLHSSVETIGSSRASDGPTIGPYGDWALLSDGEMIELAERVLRGMVVPELLRRLSRREIISLLMAQHDMGVAVAPGSLGRSNCLESATKAGARPGDAAGGASLDRSTEVPAPPLRHQGGYDDLPRSPRPWGPLPPSPPPPPPVPAPSPAWRDDSGWRHADEVWRHDSFGVPPTMPELPNPWDVPHFVTARYLTSRGRDRGQEVNLQDYASQPAGETQASASKASPDWGALPGSGHRSGLADEAAHVDSDRYGPPASGSHSGRTNSSRLDPGPDRVELVKDLREEVLLEQSSERAARLMRNEDTLKQLAEGAQRLLQKAKLETNGGWEDSNLRDHYDVKREKQTLSGRLPNAPCPAEDTEDPLLATRSR